MEVVEGAPVRPMSRRSTAMLIGLVLGCSWPQLALLAIVHARRLCASLFRGNDGRPRCLA